MILWEQQQFWQGKKWLLEPWDCAACNTGLYMLAVVVLTCFHISEMCQSAASSRWCFVNTWVRIFSGSIGGNNKHQSHCSQCEMCKTCEKCKKYEKCKTCENCKKYEKCKKWKKYDKCEKCKKYEKWKKCKKCEHFNVYWDKLIASKPNKESLYNMESLYNV